MNQNQRYEVLMHFPGYEDACGIPRVESAANRTFCHNGCSYRSGYVLTDFNDFGGGFGVAEFGEVVAAACEFQEEGFVGSGFQRT